MSFLAFDTSNYTTSVAYLKDFSVYVGNHLSVPLKNQSDCISETRLLQVSEGALGLRQQEALFQHVKALPKLMEGVFTQVAENNLKSLVKAIGISTKPRETEDSYMPCFLAGESTGKSMATLLNVPIFEFSHQQGHLAAALFSLQRLEILEIPFLCWHISGGTTELLLVKPRDQLFSCEIIGGTSDISAGQLLDRTGQKLGLPFPSGKLLDQLTQDKVENDENHVFSQDSNILLKTSKELKPFPVKEKNLYFSLSGMENKVEVYMKEGRKEHEIACFVLDTIGLALKKVSAQAKQKYGEDLPLVFCGGVASSSRLKKNIPDGLFPPSFSTDNAMGIAVLTQMCYQNSLSLSSETERSERNHENFHPL